MDRPPFVKRLRRRLRYHAVRVFIALASLLPVRFAAALGRVLGAVAFVVARTDRRRALESLEAAFPELSAAERLALARRSFRHLGTCAFELCCVRKLDADLERWVEWPDADRKVLETALTRKKGVVFVSGHVGNWELLARRVARAGFPSQSIAKETTDAKLTALIAHFRREGGVKSIWRGQKGAAREMLRALKGGEILGMLIDQDTRVQSVFVPFFGHPAATPRAAADLALRTGAAFVVGFCQRQHGGRYRLTMKELSPTQTGDFEADVRELTASATREIEAAILRAPEQWVWMHRRWKTKP